MVQHCFTELGFQKGKVDVVRWVGLEVLRDKVKVVVLFLLLLLFGDLIDPFFFETVKPE